MGDSIGEVEKLLDETARRCLRCIVAEKGVLTPDETAALAKWLFGCMNQKSTIRKRVERSGSGELAKVLKFVGKACEQLLAIDIRLSGNKS